MNSLVEFTSRLTPSEWLEVFMMAAMCGIVTKILVSLED
jgi:hypothetical protein